MHILVIKVFLLFSACLLLSFIIIRFLVTISLGELIRKCYVEIDGLSIYDYQSHEFVDQYYIKYKRHYFDGWSLYQAGRKMSLVEAKSIKKQFYKHGINKMINYD